MYSEALAVLDHNTELFMIKEAHQEIEELKLEKDTLLQEKDALQQTLAKYEAKYGKL
jgi:hypothetical protein